MAKRKVTPTQRIRVLEQRVRIKNTLIQTLRAKVERLKAEGRVITGPVLE